MVFIINYQHQPEADVTHSAPVTADFLGPF